MTNKQLQAWVVDSTYADTQEAARVIAQRYKKAQEEIMADIKRAYEYHLATAKPEDYYNVIIKFDRLASLLNDTRARYQDYIKLANADVVNASAAAMTNAYYRKQYQLNWLHDKAIKFTVLDPRIVELSVLGTDQSWRNITKRLEERYLKTGQMARQLGSLSIKLQNDGIASVREIEEIITTNLRRGTGIREMTSRIQGIMTNHTWQAARIAQTESTRTMNLGQQLSTIDAARAGVKIQRMWMITNRNTRPNHAALDGKLAEVDQPWKNGPMRPGAWGSAKDDINEHCWVFDAVLDESGEPQGPTLRRGRNPVTGKNEVMTQADFEKWTAMNNLYTNSTGALAQRKKQ